MKPPGTIVRHDSREYLLVEGGFNPETRSIILLARPADPLFPAGEDRSPISWGRQGDWIPVGRENGSGLNVPDEKHAQHTALVKSLIDDYKAKRAAPPTVAWTARRGGGYAGVLHPALPMGFAAALHDTRDAAAAEPEVAEVVGIDSLPMFFTHLVREGYAGALWDDRPVFFCVDQHEDLQFLRVSPPAVAGGDPVFEILEETGRFGPYDGEEQVEFIDNRDDCDARLVASVGRIALVDWPADNRLWSLGQKLGEAAILQPETEESGEEAVPHGVLFTREEDATTFKGEVAPELVVFAVNDISKFLSQPPLAGCIAALNPGGHRATSGLLWHDGQRVVLDSFSGFWAYDSGNFELLKE